MLIRYIKNIGVFGLGLLASIPVYPLWWVKTLQAREKLLGLGANLLVFVTLGVSFAEGSLPLSLVSYLAPMVLGTVVWGGYYAIEINKRYSGVRFIRNFISPNTNYPLKLESFSAEMPYGDFTYKAAMRLFLERILYFYAGPLEYVYLLKGRHMSPIEMIKCLSDLQINLWAVSRGILFITGADYAFFLSPFGMALIETLNHVNVKTCPTSFIKIFHQDDDILSIQNLMTYDLEAVESIIEAYRYKPILLFKYSEYKVNPVSQVTVEVKNGNYHSNDNLYSY